MPATEAKLYVILGSHSCRTGMLLLEHKGVSYRRVEVPTGLHPLALRLLGFEGNRAPLRSTGERPNRPLATLDRLQKFRRIKTSLQDCRTTGPRGTQGHSRFLAHQRGCKSRNSHDNVLSFMSPLICDDMFLLVAAGSQRRVCPITEQHRIPIAKF